LGYSLAMLCSDFRTKERKMNPSVIMFKHWLKTANIPEVTLLRIMRQLDEAPKQNGVEGKKKC